jgi:hypothetical protein
MAARGDAAERVGTRAARWRLRRIGARLALAGLGSCGLAIAVGSAGGASPLTPSSRGGFPAWMAGPFGGLWAQPLGDGFWLLLLGMAVCYLAALTLASEIGPRLAVAAVLALHVVFLLAPPLLTTDPFGYLAYARLTGDEGLSPYATGLSALAEGDPVRAFFGWERGPSPYGPLFTVTGLALAPLGLAGGLWILKGLAAGASLLTLALVWRVAPRLGRARVPALLFAGLNPVLLVWAVAGAHNDLLVATLLVGSIALVVERRDGLAGALAGAAAGVKASAGLLLPLLVLGVRARGHALIGSVGALAFGAILGLVVLGPRGLAGYPAALAEQAAFVSENSVVDLAGAALGLGGATPGLRLAAALVLAGGMIVLAVRVHRSRSRPGHEGRLVAAWGCATLLALVTTTWLMVWYVVLVLPLAALAPRRGLRTATLALCLFVVLTRVPVTKG